MISDTKPLFPLREQYVWGKVTPPLLRVQDLSASFKGFLLEMSKLKRETKITLTDPRRKLYYLKMSNWKMERVFLQTSLLPEYSNE